MAFIPLGGSDDWVETSLAERLTHHLYVVAVLQPREEYKTFNVFMGSHVSLLYPSLSCVHPSDPVSSW